MVVFYVRNNRKLRVKALPANLPDFIEVDITILKIGDKVYISELATEDYTFLHPDNTVVCQVRRSRAAVVEDEDEEEERRCRRCRCSRSSSSRIDILFKYIKSILFIQDAFLFLQK